MTRLDLIEQFENETELPATWNNGGMGGYTKEYTEWLEQRLVKNLTIPVVVGQGSSLHEPLSSNGLARIANLFKISCFK